MKELSIEEKAKAYDEAKLRMSAAYNSNRCTIGFMNEIFPELKDSEDERIRKIIKQSLKSYFEGKLSIGTNDVDYAECLSWLKKQGEHAKFRDSIQVGDKVTRNQDGVLVNLSQLKRVAKPADKIEPKFKVGDFIINDYCMGRVIEITNDAYLLDTEQGIPLSHEHNAHLWTIQDAKDGDVLVNDNEIVIFKENNFNPKDLSGCMFVYCAFFNKCGYWYEIGGINPTDYKPATKEQRDLLFQKMYEAGYEWDAEKKKLKKIKQKLANKVEPKFKHGDRVKNKKSGLEQTLGSCIEDIYEGAFPFRIKDQDDWELVEQNTAGSEDDEKMFEYALDMIEWYSGKNENKSRLVSNWLKSLKDRVLPQPRQEWSEEDEKMFESIIKYLKERTYSAFCPYLKKDVDWLKSLKDRIKGKIK